METLPGVVTRDIQDYLTKDVSFEIGSKMYSMKGACMMATELDQVMFIDADNIPARDPTFLFETPAFKETGALFWKDFWKTRPDNHIFDLLEIECKDEYEQESGQIVIQKTFPGVYKALSLAYYFQSKPELYFKLLLGDKDTFRYAWRALNFSYHLVYFV